jgi:hypothetical protein
VKRLFLDVIFLLSLFSFFRWLFVTELLVVMVTNQVEARLPSVGVGRGAAY